MRVESASREGLLRDAILSVSRFLYSSHLAPDTICLEVKIFRCKF